MTLRCGRHRKGRSHGMLTFIQIMTTLDCGETDNRLDRIHGTEEKPRCGNFAGVLKERRPILGAGDRKTFSTCERLGINSYE